MGGERVGCCGVLSIPSDGGIYTICSFGIIGAGPESLENRNTCHGIISQHEKYPSTIIWRIPFIDGCLSMHRSRKMGYRIFLPVHKARYLRSLVSSYHTTLICRRPARRGDIPMQLTVRPVNVLERLFIGTAVASPVKTRTLRKPAPT